MEFSLQQTLECGQFFQYRKENGGYWVVSSGKRAFIRQEGSDLSFEETDDIPFWRGVLDLDRDYDGITARLTENDPVMREAARFAPGIRLMNQDPWECLLGFVISQNNRVPMIIKTLANISRRFGQGFPDGCDFSPPGCDTLALVSEEEIKECRCGFRAKYILDAARKAAAGEVPLSPTYSASTETLRAELMKIGGVGRKVADCVMLFSLGRRDVFPADVWIIRIMRKLYFGGREAAPKEIQRLAAERFGDLAGYAQQFLFHYARTLRIV